MVYRHSLLASLASSNPEPVPSTLDPLLNMFESGEDGCILDMTAGTMFTDTGKTTVAEDGDNVRVWADRSGLGNDFVSDSDALRPPLSTATGALHLAFSNHMFRGPAAPFGNYSDLTFFVGIRGSSSGDTVLGVPHSSSGHTNPFFRWNFFLLISGGFKLSSRFNGITDSTGALSINTTPACMGADPGSNNYYEDGAVESSPTMSSPITYPDPAPVRIGENGGGGERFAGEIYFFFLINRSLSLTEVELVNTHCQTFFP